MTPLCELGRKYGTDKYPWYTPFYDLLLHSSRESCRRVLEIGIGTKQAMKHVEGYKPGASLRMWRDYFPNALVAGVDRDSDVLFQGEPRIQTFLGNQEDPEVLAAWFSWSLNLIVDDGSHYPDHQISTFQALFPKLVPGGLYIIEDVNSPLILPGLPHQFVECRVPGNIHAGRLIVVRK